MIAAIMTVLNEADIIDYTLRHLYLEGIDRVYIAHGPSTDGTAKLIDPDRWAYGFVTVIEDDTPYHAQVKWMAELAKMAGEDGAHWILPIDADEFWYTTDGGKIADSLISLPSSIRSLKVPMIRHISWDYRQEIETLPKCCFRYQEGVTIANGNHACSVVGGEAADVLALRELCYRSLDHFMRKTRERNALIDPSLPLGEGAHQRQYAGMDDDQLREAWTQYSNIPRWKDPIPSRLESHPTGVIIRDA